MIGVEGPMTGIYAEIGAGLWNGARAAAAEINAEGGILGNKIQLVQIDDADDPADAVPALDTAIATNHIVALDGSESTVLPAIEPIVTENQIPEMFQGGSTAFNTNTNKWVWRPSPSDSSLGVAMAAYALSKHYTRAAILFTQNASAGTLSVQVKQTFTQNGGKIVSDQLITPGASSYASVVEAVVASHPQVVFTQTDPTSGATIWKNFQQIDNLAIPFVGSDLTAGGDFISAIGASVAHKSLLSVQGTTSTGPGVAPFVKYYKQLFHSTPISGANYSYDAILEFALAIQEAGSTNGSKIDAAIAKVSNPPGIDVSTWSTGLKDLKAKKKVHFVGAGGPAGFNQYHNSVGTFGAFRANADGSLTSVASLSVSTLAKAAAGQLHP
ncbi:MAG TPA: ABC transporter substrate-binding protein [Candidatus Dormibacteraeota bacterium]|nr:ABC transporter substrate-binding protein [Candidatus Dormibacteraeota bacterium]